MKDKMASYTAIISFVHEPYLTACMATLKIPRENILVIDGRLPDDPGLAGSLNKGIDLMRQRDSDWLVVINPAMRFGEAGGLDIPEWLQKSRANYIYFGEKDIEPQQFKFGHNNSENFAWHCCAIRSEVFDKIGKLDPNFYPVYFEDVDFDLRYRKQFGNTGLELLPIDAYNESYGHSVELAGAKINLDALITYGATKWGVHPSAVYDLESYKHPFNDSKNSLAFWPPARGQTWDE